MSIIKGFSLLFALLIITGCRSGFGEMKDFEKDSNEATMRLRYHLKISELDSILAVNYFMDETSSDPYYVARFKTKPKVVDRIIEHLHMTRDTTGKYTWIPEQSPAWFAPPLGPEHKPYMVSNAASKEFLYYDSKHQIGYYANLSW